MTDQNVEVLVLIEKIADLEKQLQSKQYMLNRMSELLERQNQRLHKSYKRNQINERMIERLDKLLQEQGQ